MVCETVIEGKDGVLSLVKVIDRVILTAAPGAPNKMPPVTRNFWLVLMFVSGPLRGMANVNVTLQDPLGLRKAMHGQRVLFEGEDRGVNLAFQVTMEFVEEGLYWFDISVDDEPVTRTPFRIVYSRVSQDLPPMA